MHTTQTIIIIITLRDHAIFMDNNVDGLDVAVALFVTLTKLLHIQRG